MNEELSSVNTEIRTTESLAVVPSMELDWVKRWSGMESSVLENMRVLMSRINRSGVIPKRLSVLSAVDGEGVTTICRGMGMIAASDYDYKTCIVDLNWYSPSAYSTTEAPGSDIVDILENGIPVVEAIRQTVIDNLYVLPAGQVDEHKRHVVAHSKALKSLFEELDQLFDLIILDVPAVQLTSDAIELAGYGLACCLVVRQGVTPIQDIKLALDEIRYLEVLGVVLNRVSFQTPEYLIRFLAS